VGGRLSVADRARAGTPERARRPDGMPERGRCLVMGILNVTPDSFSDGGAYFDTSRAIDHGLALAADGADIVDVGGESTRPGALPVPPEQELSRVLPVVRDLAAAGVFVSVDTMHAAVACAALAAGARMVNDVSGGLADRVMARVVAAAQVPYVTMHWRAPSSEMKHHAIYGDVVAEVTAELRNRVAALTACGVRQKQIILDPGLGFAKRPPHDWMLLGHLRELRDLGFPPAHRRLTEVIHRRHARSGERGERAAARRGRGKRRHISARRGRRRLLRTGPRRPGQPRCRPRRRRLEPAAPIGPPCSPPGSRGARHRW